MRHSAQSAPSPPGGGAISRGQVIFALVALVVAPYAGLDSFTVDPRIAEVWPLGGVGFVLLSTVWAAGRRAIGAASAAMVLVTGVTALALGYSPGAAGWIALCGAAQPLLMMLAYRRMRGGEGWVPVRPADLFGLLLASVGSSLLVGLVGGFPHLAVGDLPSVVLLWWVLRTTVFCFTVAVIFSVLFHSPASEEVLEPSPWANRLALVPVAALCVVGTYHDPSLPLSWLLLVPAVWGGLTLTMRGVAYVLLLVAVTAAGLTYLPQNQFGYAGWLPAASIVDTLITAATCFAVLLALMRQQRARLIAQLDQRGREAEHQRELLSTVVDSMTEGVLLIGAEGVRTRNAAARQLLGRPIPTDGRASWVETFGLTGPEGQPMTDEELRARMARADGVVSEVRVGSGPDARVLEVVSKQLSRGDEGAGRVLLLRDVTAQRARLRELTSFAGHVAHDLRGPLTVLDGWLEVAFDEDSDHDDIAGALARAHEASQRMRQVIEDWLGYTVVQQGRIRPEPVKLAEIARSLVESRISTVADDDRPRISLDLTHHVLADPGLLRQLLDNLVDNAIKYTEAGRAPVVTVRSRDDVEPGWVRVEVVDEGMGIPEGQEEAIFEEFHKGPVHGRSEGTGLGLSLTRRIVALHGGEMTARRNPDRGSTFTFTLRSA